MKRYRNLALTGLACSALLLPGHVLAQVATGEGVQIPLLRILGAFLLCVIIALAAAFLLRGRVRGGKWLTMEVSPKRLRILESTRVNLRTTLLLVSVDERILLLACDAKGAQLLSDLGVAAPKEVIS